MVSIRKFFFGVVPVALAISLIAGAAEAGSLTFRYRMGVTLDTPDGLKAGQGVMEVEYSWPFLDRFFAVGEREYRVTGESIPIKLRNGGIILVLLTSDLSRSRKSIDCARLPLFAYDFSMEKSRSKEDFDRMKKIGRGDIPLSMLPTIVFLSNAADPKTIKIVDPENVSATLGSGYALMAAFVEPTDAPVTDILTSELPWLASLGSNSPLDQDLFRRQEYRPLDLRGYQFKANRGSMP